MAVTSTVPGFKAALLSRLQADATIGATGTFGHPVQITWGIPTSPAPDRWWVSLGNVKSEQRAEFLGAQRRIETFTMDIEISVMQPVRTDPQSVADDAYTIAAAIETSIRSWGARGVADPFSTSTTGVQWVQVGGLDLEEKLDDSNREALITMRIDVESRI